MGAKLGLSLKDKTYKYLDLTDEQEYEDTYIMNKEIIMLTTSQNTFLTVFTQKVKLS